MLFPLPLLSLPLLHLPSESLFPLSLDDSIVPLPLPLRLDQYSFPLGLLQSTDGGGSTVSLITLVLGLFLLLRTLSEELGESTLLFLASVGDTEGVGLLFLSGLSLLSTESFELSEELTFLSVVIRGGALRSRRGEAKETGRLARTVVVIVRVAMSATRTAVMSTMSVVRMGGNST